MVTLVLHRRLRGEWSEGILLGEARLLTIRRGRYLTVVGSEGGDTPVQSHRASKPSRIRSQASML